MPTRTENVNKINTASDFGNSRSTVFVPRVPVSARLVEYNKVPKALRVNVGLDEPRATFLSSVTLASGVITTLVTDIGRTDEDERISLWVKPTNTNMSLLQIEVLPVNGTDNDWYLFTGHNAFASTGTSGVVAVGATSPSSATSGVGAWAHVEVGEVDGVRLRGRTTTNGNVDVRLDF